MYKLIFQLSLSGAGRMKIVKSIRKEVINNTSLKTTVEI